MLFWYFEHRGANGIYQNWTTTLMHPVLTDLELD